MTGELSFFSIGVGDAGKARSFYGSLFGWEFSDGPSGNGAVIENTSVGGGIHGEDPGASPYLFFSVEDLDSALALVRDLGGDVDEHEGDERGDEASVARFGRFRLCRDDQGSSFGLHQPPAEGTEGDPQQAS